VHPQAEQESILGHFCWAGRGGDLEVYLVYLDRLLRAKTKKKKKVVNFFEQKSAPPDKILATPMLVS